MKIDLYLKHFPLAGAPLRVGTNKAVHGLASGLAANGAQVTVLCEGEQDGRHLTDAGYEIRCFRSQARYRTFRLAQGLRDYFAQPAGGERLVVLNGIFHPSLYSLSRLLLEHGVPYVVAPHGPYHPWLFRKNPYLKWPYWYLVERRLLRCARAIQLLDRRQAVWSQRLGVHTPVIETPNGFTAADVVPDAQLQWRSEGPIRLLYWGRLDIHTKGLDILLEAFPALAAAAEARLTLQGPDWLGQQTAPLKQLVDRLPDAGRVEMLPPVFDRPAAEVIGGYDVLCSPSRFEGFGLSALEAMLAGRVLLVSECAGIAPHVQASGCGVVVQPEPASVRDGLIELARRRDQWREMGCAGRRHALRHLSWNAIAGNVLGHYRRLVH